MKKLLSISFFALISLINCHAQSWKLAKDKNNVKVYTRQISGWKIKEYKAVFEVKSTLNKVINIIKDVDSRKTWLHNTIEVREIERPNNDIVSIYSQVDAPWPVSNRDNITQFSFKYLKEDLVKVDMKLIYTHPKAPLYNGIVRINKLQGHWLIKDQKNGFIEVTQQCVAEPGGSIPDWLANSAVVDSPYNTMFKLKNYIEKH